MKKNVLLLVFVLISSLSFGQIFITELADPNDAYDARYVELFNMGDTDIDLNAEGYGLNRAQNGDEPNAEIIPLTGVIPAKGFYLVSYYAAIFETTYGFASNQEMTGGQSPTANNGDDQTRLLKITATDTIPIDIFGVIGEDGNGTCHGFYDGRAERVASVTTGNGETWTEANWNVWGEDVSAGCTNYVTASVNTTDGMFDPGAWIGYTPPNFVEFESINSQVNEDGTSIDVCVTIEYAPDSDVSVDINLSNASTVVNGTDITSITFPHTVTFAAGIADNQCLTISITDDIDPELEETLVLTLENPVGIDLGTKVNHTLSIIDNDLVCPGAGELI